MNSMRMLQQKILSKLLQHFEKTIKQIRSKAITILCKCLGSGSLDCPDFSQEWVLFNDFHGISTKSHVHTVLLHLPSSNKSWKICFHFGEVWGLVGKVWRSDFSAFSDTDTNVQHVQTCRKKLKNCKTLGQKTCFWACSSFIQKCTPTVPKN